MDNTITDEYKDFFNVVPLTNVEKNTAVEQTSLSLTQFHTYMVMVMATDEAGACGIITAETTVDITPPTEGHLGVGPEYNKVSAAFLITWLISL